MENRSSNENNDVKLLPQHHTIAGATSGVLCRCFGQPLDVLKIRFQLQNVEHGKLKYTGIISGTKSIVQNEGITGLWKGHIPAQILSVIYGGVQFSAFEYTKSILHSETKEGKPVVPMPLIYFMSGATAGVCSTLACHPVDVIRTRLVAQSNVKVYNGLLDACISMFKESGIRTFYKDMLAGMFMATNYTSIVPNLAMVLPHDGLKFCFYGLFGMMWNSVFATENSKMKPFISGSLSGICSKLILLPLDNMKKRLQVQGFKGHAHIDGGMCHIMRKVFEQQGVRGLYQGAAPSLLKAALVTGLTFYVYEQVCELLRSRI